MGGHGLLLWSFLLFSLLFTQGASYRILVTLLGVSGSQNLVMYRLAEYLGQRGHDVLVLKAEIFPEAKSIPLKYTRELRYQLIPPKETDEIRQMMYRMPWEITDSAPLPLGLFKRMLNAAVTGCENLVTKNAEAMNELRREKFDMAILHLVDFCGFGLARALGIEGYVWMSTAFQIDPMGWYAGVPYPSSFVPSGALAAFPEMTFFQRGKNLVSGIVMQAVTDTFILPPFTKVFQKTFGKDFPSIPEILRNTSLYFVNADPFFDFPRPTQHNIVYIGGFTSKKPDPLSPEWDKIVNESQKGVVVFSLGSVVNTAFMPNKLKSAFLNAFKRFPKYTFVCRMEGEIPDKDSLKNVIISQWLPQKDLLANEKVRAFITHGGYNSLTESTYYGVPLIMFPLFGDQYANVKRVERLNVGVFIDKYEVTEEKVYQALKTVLESEKIQESADRLGRMIQKKPVSSLDLVINWVEFLAEFKTVETLLPESRNMCLVKYYMIDVLSIAFGVVFVGFFVFFKCFAFCFRKICGKKQKTD